jgi:hypothetical protein
MDHGKEQHGSSQAPLLFAMCSLQVIFPYEEKVEVN